MRQHIGCGVDIKAGKGYNSFVPSLMLAINIRYFAYIISKKGK